MATILYKNGSEVRVEAGQVQRMLADGYSVENKPAVFVEKEPAASFEEPDESIIVEDQDAKPAVKRGRKPCLK